MIPIKFSFCRYHCTLSFALLGNIITYDRVPQCIKLKSRELDNLAIDENQSADLFGIFGFSISTESNGPETDVVSRGSIICWILPVISFETLLVNGPIGL